jgi:hypothetical protein
MATTHKNKVELIDYLIEMLCHDHLRIDLRENLLNKTDSWCLELISLIDNHTNHGIQKAEVIAQKEWDTLEKEFTAADMLEFAQQFTDMDLDESYLDEYRESLKSKEEAEYQQYLKLKEKYEQYSKPPRAPFGSFGKI